MEQICYNIAYVLATSLQLSAGLLLVGNTNISRNGVIKEYASRHTAIAFEEDGKLADNSDLKLVVKTSWINKIAFIYLVFGYFIGIFGESLSNKKMSVLLTIFLVWILTYVAFKISQKKASEFKTVSKEDIPMTNGVAFCILDSTNELM